MHWFLCTLSYWWVLLLKYGCPPNGNWDGEVGGCWGHVDSRDLTKVPADEEDGVGLRLRMWVFWLVHVTVMGWVCGATVSGLMRWIDCSFLLIVIVYGLTRAAELHGWCFLEGDWEECGFVIFKVFSHFK
jgi:hypothetical protein